MIFDVMKVRLLVLNIYICGYKYKQQEQKQQPDNTWKRTSHIPRPTVCNYHVLAAAVHAYALNGLTL